MENEDVREREMRHREREGGQHTETRHGCTVMDGIELVRVDI